MQKEGLEMQINRLAELIGRLENKVRLFPVVIPGCAVKHPANSVAKVTILQCHFKSKKINISCRPVGICMTISQSGPEVKLIKHSLPILRIGAYPSPVGGEHLGQDVRLSQGTYTVTHCG